ncbi:MAG: peptidoglycan-associated lipoprotein Pal [Methylococcaceae bacterium]|nr:peptidoglycan-associated lipoprotein Pal [Methylococcaceae bacterium]
MKFNLRYIAILLALSTLLLGGCSSTDEKQDGFVDETAGLETPDNGVKTQGLGDNALGGSESGGSANAHNGMGGGPDGTKTIYFMYDSSQVKEEFVPVIAQHARSLKTNAGQHVIVQGHSDERGSREYNIALGEQRAKAVARMLTMQGVAESQVETVSYGEEKPAANGHDESAWQLNRRVELDYQGQ